MQYSNARLTVKNLKTMRGIRNGIETVLSNLRKNCQFDKLPRGKRRGKFFLGSKIAALNFKKPINWLKGHGNYAQNLLLIG